MLSFEENYLFIKELLNNALKIDVEILKPPYHTIQASNNELRKLFWSNFHFDDKHLIESIQEAPKNYMICINSKLGFNSILYRVPSIYEDCILLIGPFLPEGIHNDFLRQIIERNQFPLEVIQTLQEYYQTLPHVDHRTVRNTLTTLLTHITPEYDVTNVKVYDFTQSDEITITPSFESAYDFKKQLYQACVSIHNSVFQQLGNTDYEEIYKDVEQYLHKSGLMKETSLQVIKYGLNKFNIKCEFVLYQKKVHYIYVQKLFESFEQKIQAERSRDKLLLLPYEMVKKYSLLVRNYSLAQYSQTVRKAIDYISFHLQEPLSLSIIAEHVGKNNSFLSHQFKKETGMTVTNYIHEKRIEQATTLLNTTSLSIQEIAEKVGILELNYFSKLFKKQIGMSPSDYKKLIK